MNGNGRERAIPLNGQETGIFWHIPYVRILLSCLKEVELMICNDKNLCLSLIEQTLGLD